MSAVVYGIENGDSLLKAEDSGKSEPAPLMLWDQLLPVSTNVLAPINNY